MLKVKGVVTSPAPREVDFYMKSSSLTVIGDSEIGWNNIIVCIPFKCLLCSLILIPTVL